MIHKHEPVPEEDMWYISPKYTICQVLRDIYFEAVRIGSREIQVEARVAVAMAKAMNSQLKEYNRNWWKGFYDPNIAESRDHDGAGDVLGSDMEGKDT